MRQKCANMYVIHISNKNINFENVRILSTLDTRIGVSHTMVPGPDSKRGFGGICLPKDLNSMIHQFHESNIKPIVLQSVLERNEIDRPEKDWEADSGRAVI